MATIGGAGPQPKGDVATGRRAAELSPNGPRFCPPGRIAGKGDAESRRPPVQPTRFVGMIFLLRPSDHLQKQKGTGR